MSDHGRVRCLKNGSVTIKKITTDTKGYKYTTIKHKKYQIHRLVAYAFCTQHKGKNIVNHLDCNPANNYYKNLEWTDSKGNTEWAMKMGRFSNIELIVHDKETKEFRWYGSINQCAKQLHIGKQNIRAALETDGVYKNFVIQKKGAEAPHE